MPKKNQYIVLHRMTYESGGAPCVCEMEYGEGATGDKPSSAYVKPQKGFLLSQALCVHQIRQEVLKLFVEDPENTEIWVAGMIGGLNQKYSKDQRKEFKNKLLYIAKVTDVATVMDSDELKRQLSKAQSKDIPDSSRLRSYYPPAIEGTNIADPDCGNTYMNRMDCIYVVRDGKLMRREMPDGSLFNPKQHGNGDEKAQKKDQKISRKYVLLSNEFVYYGRECKNHSLENKELLGYFPKSISYSSHVRLRDGKETSKRCARGKDSGCLSKVHNFDRLYKLLMDEWDPNWKDQWENYRHPIKEYYSDGQRG